MNPLLLITRLKIFPLEKASYWFSLELFSFPKPRPSLLQHPLSHIRAIWGVLSFLRPMIHLYPSCDLCRASSNQSGLFMLERKSPFALLCPENVSWSITLKHQNQWPHSPRNSAGSEKRVSPFFMEHSAVPILWAHAHSHTVLDLSPVQTMVTNRCWSRVFPLLFFLHPPPTKLVSPALA